VGPHAEAAAFGAGAASPGLAPEVGLSPPVLLDVGHMTRPLLAATLRAGWGVAPPHSDWSVEAGDFASDYAWEVGRTPFGPWSTMIGLPFAARDAAQRHVVTSAQAAALMTASTALSDLAAVPGAVAALPKAVGDTARTRGEVLLHKLRASAAAMGHHQFDAAAYFARSALHDAAALEAALHAGARTMTVSLSCGQSSGLAATASAGLTALVLIAGVCGALLCRAQRGQWGQKKKQW
jgi:hypothetical protein